MKQFSNKYIFIYSALLVAVVAVVLSVVSVSLKPRQQRNVQIEQKQMILRAMGVDASPQDAERLYVEKIEERTLDAAGVYYCFKGGFIVPFRGTGLWGPVWGYVAFDYDQTIVGAVFDHQGETPGLGGEIASRKFAERFVGKSFADIPVALVKHADPADKHKVDAISGGTMTSNGVTAMFADDYDRYCAIYAAASHHQ